MSAPDWLVVLHKNTMPDSERGPPRHPLRSGNPARRLYFAIGSTPEADDAYEGGFLHLPEFSQNHYRCPTGAAIIFSVALMHEITPVIRGDRYVLVTHLFDELGEIERQEVEGRT